MNTERLKTAVHNVRISGLHGTASDIELLFREVEEELHNVQNDYCAMKHRAERAERRMLVMEAGLREIADGRGGLMSQSIAINTMHELGLELPDATEPVKVHIDDPALSLLAIMGRHGWGKS